MNHNPTLLTTEALNRATEYDILRAQYELLVATIEVTFALVTFYVIFKFLVWFLPKYWYKPSEDTK